MKTFATTTRALSGAGRAGTSAVLGLMLAAMVTIHLHAQSADYIIGPQDVLAIQIFDQADLGGKYTVETDGSFSFPLIGRITAGGMTLRKFEGELRRQLADGYFRNPQVSVTVEQYRSQRIFVMGEVRNPGPVPLSGNMSLIEALARAGSTLPSASGEIAIVRAPQGATGPSLPSAANAATVARATIRDLESGTMKQNVELRDGDTIFVPRAESAYVFGEVKTPGAYAIQKDTTVLQALSLAGGVTDGGALNRIRVVRLIDDERTEVKVKLNDLVQPGDTIIVPEKYF